MVLSTLYDLKYQVSSQKKNGTQVNGYNFVTVDLKYLKFCR